MKGEHSRGVDPEPGGRMVIEEAIVLLPIGQRFVLAADKNHSRPTLPAAPAIHFV